ncbi:unnamed protein product, partial [marine sediment metagenome]
AKIRAQIKIPNPVPQKYCLHNPFCTKKAPIKNPKVIVRERTIS